MKHLIATLLFFCFLNLSAQSITQCGDRIIKHQLENKYPGITDIIDESFKTAHSTSPNKSVVLRIPVVFHVIYNKDDENISDELLKDQLAVLNEDFRRMNENANDSRDIFQDLATDAEIEFFLAGQDPVGNPTNGITRTFTEKETFIDIGFTDLLQVITECGFDLEDPDVFDCIFELLGGGLDIDQMKSSETGGVDAWDTNRYLNIWVVNVSLESAGTQQPFILGFAYPPTEAPNWPDGTIPEDIEAKDGVVLHYQVVGRNNPTIGALAGINDQGRTAVHEVGHYLGLRHIWGDGDCTMDDGIQDTPSASSNSQATVDVSACSELHMKDSCIDDMLPDMLENYMDYSIERCQNMFTLEQVDLMRSMLEGPRSGLLSNTISSVENVPSLQPVVFPNPSSGQINILSWNEKMQVKIYNRAGALIMKSNQASFSINASPGLYFIEITDMNVRYFEKVVIK